MATNGSQAVFTVFQAKLREKLLNKSDICTIYCSLKKTPICYSSVKDMRKTHSIPKIMIFLWKPHINNDMKTIRDHTVNMFLITMMYTV